MLEMNEENSTKLNGYFKVDETYENENWIKTSIRTFAFGKNRNQSDIAESSMSEFNKARKTIGGIPIVAKYNEDKDDLEGHNVTLRKNKDGEYEFYHDTTPLGFTSPTSTFFTEEVNEGTESFPNYKTYITVNDVYLWKRFDATKKILNWQANNIPAKVSMEISDVSGEFDSEGYFAINDFVFTAIAALGSDVEPCFPKAEIQLYTVNDFKADLKQLMYELTTQVDVDSKGGNEDLEETKQEFETQEEQVESTETQVEEVVTTESNTEDVEVTQETSEEFTDETQTTEQVEEESKVEETDGQSTTDEVEEVFEETQVESEVVEDEVSTDTEEVVNEFEVKFNDLTEQFNSIQSELEELRAFKRETLEKELSAKFEGQLDSKEITDVFEQSKVKSLEEIEVELYALLGKKNFSMQQEQKQEVKIAVNIQETKSEVNEPYGGLFAKYLDK